LTPRRLVVSAAVPSVPQDMPIEARFDAFD